MLKNDVVDGQVVVPRTPISPWATIAIHLSTAGTGDLCHAGNVIGKPLIIYWSYDAPTEQLASPNIGLDHIVDVALHFFTKTRWRRTFMLIHGYNVDPVS